MFSAVRSSLENTKSGNDGLGGSQLLEEQLKEIQNQKAQLSGILTENLLHFSFQINQVYCQILILELESQMSLNKLDKPLKETLYLFDYLPRSVSLLQISLFSKEKQAILNNAIKQRAQQIEETKNAYKELATQLAQKKKNLDDAQLKLGELSRQEAKIKLALLENADQIPSTSPSKKLQKGA